MAKSAPAKVTVRETRYAYHVSGLAGCTHTTSPDPDDPPATYSVPFDVVVRRRLPITSDDEMDEARDEVLAAVQRAIDAAMTPAPIVNELSVRNVALLHTILVDADDPDGQAARVLS